VFPRLGDDVETVGWYEAAGFTGCVLKGHSEPTAGRALAASAGRKLAVNGAVVLNAAVGGLNPPYVEAALAFGARVVWMPTLDALAHREAGLPRPRAESATYAIPPVDTTTEAAVGEICTLASAAPSRASMGPGGRSAGASPSSGYPEPWNCTPRSSVRSTRKAS
jgi:uncharacterized protein DUF6282